MSFKRSVLIDLVVLGFSIFLLLIQTAKLYPPVSVFAQYPTNTPIPTNTPTNTPTPTPTPTFYQMYGWVYTETNNSVSQSEESGEGLIANYTINLTGAASGSTTSQGTPISGLLGNYVFRPLYNGTYQVQLAVTPTGSVLFPLYTNPQIQVIAGGDVIANFPFVTVTPTVAPTLTPTPTTIAASPTLDPTPTAGGPTPTGGCLALPTPVLNAPAHQLCTNVKPTFSAAVANPNNDSVWAHFYSNAYETFSTYGSVQPAIGGNSEWIPDFSVLNTTGGYWWTAYTESPACPKSSDAPAWLINMDYAAPPQPTPPACTLQSQNYFSGECTFSCSWPANPEPIPASCSDTNNYHPIFWTSPAGGWDPGWMGNTLSTTVTATDGQLLYAKLSTRDNLGNISSASSDSGPFTCPKLNFSFTPIPGGPTLTPTATLTPTITPTPSNTPTPTPGNWIQVIGGNVYQSSISQDIPSGKYFLEGAPASPNSAGVIFSQNGAGNYGFGASSANDWEAGESLVNAYSFPYYWEVFKEKAKVVNNATVGAAADLDTTNTVYSYNGLGYYQLSSSFTPKTSVTIFLISGSLEITQDFSIDPAYSVVFVVNGNIFVAGDVTRIPGLYISSQVFTVATGANQFILDGMVYSKYVSLNRTYRSFSNPTYQFIYQPKYGISLLPYLGRKSVVWQEVAL